MAMTALLVGAFLPSVMGHEAAGTISAVGKNVGGFSTGDRVTVDSTVYCGACPSCRRGEINLCDRREVLGVSCGDYRRAGAFAEFVAVPSRIVHRLPDNLPFAEAALLEAVAVALHAVSLVPVNSGDSALVIGAGTIGLLLQQALRVAGCSRVFVTDIDPTRLNLSAELGATAVFPAANLAKEISSRTRRGWCGHCDRSRRKHSDHRRSDRQRPQRRNSRSRRKYFPGDLAPSAEGRQPADPAPGILCLRG